MEALDLNVVRLFLITVVLTMAAGFLYIYDDRYRLRYVSTCTIERDRGRSTVHANIND
jgi:hypothetical protein